MHYIYSVSDFRPLGLCQEINTVELQWLKQAGDHELEELKVLKRSPALLNNVKLGQVQLRLIMKHILFYHIWGLQPFWSSDPKQSYEYSIK